MEDSYLINCAAEEGFAGAAVISTDQIVFDPAFRPYCEENLCGQYGINYTCPPVCGSPENMKNRILAHKKALVLETMWEGDYTDGPAMKQGKKTHNTAAVRLLKRLRREGCEGFLVGASGCSLCKPCHMGKGEPCAFPDLRWSCMSAYCIFVKKLADTCGLEYTPGEGLVTFFGMFVFD